MGDELRNQLENEENKAAKITKRSRYSYLRCVVHKSFEEGWGNNKRAGFIKKELDKEIVVKEGSN